MNNKPQSPEREILNEERRELLQQIEEWLEPPLLILAFVWLAIFIYELVWGEGPTLNAVNTVIWVIFILDFALKLALAPARVDYLKTNWLTVIALALPALRVFRVFRMLRVLRAARTARGLRLVRLVGSFNRGMRALGKTMNRRGAGYVAALTVIVILVGGAAMYAFERQQPNSPLVDYGSAVWWTAMVMTTMGSDYFPRTAEGRVLCFVLALYAFAVFGYVTATIASFFVARDAAEEEGELPGADQMRRLIEEVTALREDIKQLGGRDV